MHVWFNTNGEIILLNVRDSPDHMAKINLETQKIDFFVEKSFWNASGANDSNDSKAMALSKTKKLSTSLPT